MNPKIENSSHIKEILQLHQAFPDRKEFHSKVGSVLKKMATDKNFMQEVVKRNFDDTGFLKQKWSGFNIPFLYIFENDFLNIKIHLFPPLESKKEHLAAHCIHHHNNYLLTTYAFFGTGYETILFDKEITEAGEKNQVHMGISENFKQADKNPHTVDAWEPHVVFAPQDLSATLLMWTPDKVRSTDTLRNVSFIKALKTPLRKLIQTFGLESTFGIAEAATYQWYVKDKKFYRIEEEAYFSKTKAEIGSEIDDYASQMIFAFLQRTDLFDPSYFAQRVKDPAFPKYYRKHITEAIAGKDIADVYHREEINIPNKAYTKADILEAVKA